MRTRPVARKDRDLQRLIQRYARYDLLVLDELGYISFFKEGAELLLQVIAERQEKGSVIITTNPHHDSWSITTSFRPRRCSVKH